MADKKEELANKRKKHWMTQHDEMADKKRRAG
jgi:hypothetical protein